MFVLQTFRNNRIGLKLAYALINLQTSRINNTRILRIKNAKFSGYSFYMNTSIWGDFQICTGVPLRLSDPKAYPESFQTSKMELFVKIVNGF